jgi:hypothetical protein
MTPSEMAPTRSTLTRRWPTLQVYLLALSLTNALVEPVADASRKALDISPQQSLLFPNLGLTDIALPVSPGTRRCCLLGTNLKMLGLIPGKQTWDAGSLGQHSYASGKGEYNGNIVTCRAGFIDTAHVRYAADLVVKYALILEALGPKGGQVRLKTEAAYGTLHFYAPAPSETQLTEWIADTAASIAIDLTTWHEIATWYNYSAVPLYTEKGSAFSPEDAFSNQLGVALGREALHRSNTTGRPYSSIMTELLTEALIAYGVLPEDETVRILDALENKANLEGPLPYEPWFDPQYSVPNYRRLLKRQTQLYGEIKPSLPPQDLLPQTCKHEGSSEQPIPTLNQAQLWDRYRLEFKLKRATTVIRGLKHTARTIDQTDFPALIQKAHDEIAQEWLQPFLNLD